jgi:hypothetical protein
LYQPAKAGDWIVKVVPENSPVGAPTIEVESDGLEWTNIKSTRQQVKTSTEVKVSSGWRVVRVYLGFPNADFCFTSVGVPLPEGCITIYAGKTKHVKLDGRTNEFSTDNIGGLDALTIVNACNAGNHDPKHERESFESEISVGIKAFIPRRREANDLQEGDFGRTETAYAKVPVVIHCLAPVAMQEAGPKPVSVDIRVKQRGDTCPKDTDIKAFIDYDKPMTGRFRVIHNGKQSKPIEIKAREVSFAGKTFYRIERLDYKLDPGKHSFKIKVIDGGSSKKETITVDCPPFEVSSTWLKYEVEDKDTCPKQVTETATIYGNRPGDAPYRIETQGGLVVTEGIAYATRDGDKYVARRMRRITMGAFDQTMRLIIPNNPSVGDQKPLKIDCLEVLSGMLDLRAFADTACEGEVALSIHTNQPGQVPYKLDCTGGKSWSRTAEAKATGPNTFIGVDTMRFDVKNNEQVNCALKTRKPIDVKVLAVKGHTFRCVKPTGVTESDALTPETRPEPKKTDKPAIAAEPPIGCANGKVKDGTCVCSRGHKRIVIGKNAWRCIKTVVIVPPKPRISCVNGKVKNGSCVCPRAHERVKAGKNVWRCVKAAPTQLAPRRTQR